MQLQEGRVCFAWGYIHEAKTVCWRSVNISTQAFGVQCLSDAERLLIIHFSYQGSLQPNHPHDLMGQQHP